MKTSVHSLVFNFVAAFFIVCGGVNVQAQTDAVVALAKKEGRVSYYGTQDMAAATAMIRSFQETYPFIKVDLFRQGTTGLMTKALAEAQAGKHAFDVISLGIMEIQLLKKKELVARYASPEAKEFAPGLKDKDGFWTSMSVLQFVIGYNTSLMSGKKVPRDWPDLLNPSWKDGLIGAERDGTVWYASMLQYWGRNKALQFMKQLSAQRPHLERGNTLRTQMMAAGEFPMAIVHAHKVEQFKAKGAPLDWVTTADPIVTQPFVLAAARHSRSPNAARLFLDFVLSKKGQLVIKENGSMPARPDMTPIAPSLDQSKLKVHYVDPALAENYNQYAKEYQEIF